MGKKVDCCLKLLIPPRCRFLSLIALRMPGLCLGGYFCLAQERILGKEFVPSIFMPFGGGFERYPHFSGRQRVRRLSEFVIRSILIAGPTQVSPRNDLESRSPNAATVMHKAPGVTGDRGHVLCRVCGPSEFLRGAYINS